LQSTPVSTRSAIHNTAWLYMEKMVTMAVLLLVNIVMARELGPKYFGTYSLLLSYIALFTPLIALGLNAIVIRELCNDKDNEGKIIGTVLTLRLLGVLLGTTCILVLASHVIEVLSPYYVLVIILVVGNSFSIFNLLEHWFQSRMQSKSIAVIRTSVLLIFSVIKLLVAFTEPSLSNFIIVQSVEWAVVGCVFGLTYYKKRNKSHKIEIDFRYGIKLLRESIWLIFSGIAAVIYLKIDQLMLGIMVDETAVGIYAIAVKFSEIWYFFPTALAAAFFPKLLSDKIISVDLYNNSLQLLLDCMFAFSLLVITFTVICSPIFIPFLYGFDYEQSASLLNIQIWACCFVFMRAITSKWLIAESLVRFSLVSQGSGAVINVIMNYYFIPLWQAEGAAWSTLVSYSFASYFCFWIFKDTRPMARKMTLALFFPIRLKSNLYKIKMLFHKNVSPK